MEQSQKQSFLKQAYIGHKPIIFFDGVCGLCNKFVDNLLRIDVDGVYLFAPLQGETAKKMLLDQPANPSEWSIIFVDQEGGHQKSTAVLRILIGLGKMRRAYAVFFIIPRLVRDWVYEYIAMNRYEWFKKLSICRIPTKEEKSRFLP